MILDVYAAFLTAASIPFSNLDGFSVSVDDFRIAVMVSRSGMVNLSIPDSFVSTDMQGEKCWVFPYTSVQDLHEHVVAMAEKSKRREKEPAEELQR